MIDFSTAKSIVIPEGEVAVITRGAEILWQKLRLPPEFQEVDYIESTGTQYLISHISLTSEHSVEIDYQLTEAEQYRAGLFGNLVSSPAARYGALLSPSNAYLEYGYGAGNEYYQTGIPDTKRHVYKQEKNKVYVDGVLVYTFPEATFTINKPAPLGTFDYTNYKPAKARYYGSRWWEGDVLVCSYKPCYRKSDGKVGMYELITGTFCTNAGTGEFICNKPKYKTEVAYLESTGTQWLDIGTTIDTSTDEIEMYFELTEAANYKWFFGEYDTNARLGLGSGDGANKRNFLYKSSAIKVTDAEMYGKKHKYTINASGGFIDDVQKASFSPFASTSTLYLFNLNIDSASDYRCKVKIWSYKQTRNGVAIRDFIPVLDWNDRPCMYDKATDELFYNAGSGEFLYELKEA